MGSNPTPSAILVRAVLHHPSRNPVFPADNDRSAFAVPPKSAGYSRVALWVGNPGVGAHGQNNRETETPSSLTSCQTGPIRGRRRALSASHGHWSQVLDFSFHAGRQGEGDGAGALSAVPLANDSLQAAECRALRQQGRDPIEARNTARQQSALDAAKAITFAQAANRYMEAHKASWRNAKHRQQWKSTLETYAEPVIGKLSIQSIDTDLVLKVIEPIWSSKPDTTKLVLQEQV